MSWEPYVANFDYSKSGIYFVVDTINNNYLFSTIKNGDKRET